jgi:hypothetical protein
MDKDLSDWREWMDFCEEREQAEAELDHEVPIHTVMSREERSPILPYIPPEVKCECGAAVCKTTHASWCPIPNTR